MSQVNGGSFHPQATRLTFAPRQFRGIRDAHTAPSLLFTCQELVARIRVQLRLARMSTAEWALKAGVLPRVSVRDECDPSACLEEEILKF